MASNKRERFREQKDFLQKNRNTIVYLIVLLALLYLGVKNIHLGPTLPAFLSPNVAKMLVEQFGLSGITTVEEDLRHFLEA